MEVKEIISYRSRPSSLETELSAARLEHMGEKINLFFSC